MLVFVCASLLRVLFIYIRHVYEKKTELGEEEREEEAFVMMLWCEYHRIISYVRDDEEQRAAI